MKNVIRTAAVALVLLAGAGTLTACSSDADTASQNLSTEAEQFKLERRIVFYNGITDKYMLTIEGRCSVESAESSLGANSLEVTCKTGPRSFKKHFLGLSDNVTYFVEQTKNAEVSVYNYEVILKPETILPEVSVETKGNTGKN